MVEQCTQLSNHFGIVDIQPDTLFIKVSEHLTADYIQHVTTISEYLRNHYPDSPASEIIQILDANRDVIMTDLPRLEDAPKVDSIEYHVNDGFTVEELPDETESNGEKSTSPKKSLYKKYRNRWNKANDKLKKCEEDCQQQQTIMTNY
ncbi:hypothetical protein CEXT_52161 [Caerostris extrusa]|uniref:Uncharacterized protein n=1 Tax=Caerostris extrusa TaxID=172846 RepID=A0AAV4YCV8_CAEEX|nr:hypothetical protein CEXT_52161 [Caerostris extrusa]